MGQFFFGGNSGGGVEGLQLDSETEGERGTVTSQWEYVIQHVMSFREIVRTNAVSNYL